jgi:hypothetical protein
MTRVPGRPFSYRAFCSVLLAVTALGLPWSGIELHAAGHGGWTRATHAWMAVHWAFAMLFLVAVAGHLAANGRALLRHVRGRAAAMLPPSRETLAALVIVTGLVLLAVGHAALD